MLDHNRFPSPIRMALALVLPLAPAVLAACGSTSNRGGSQPPEITRYEMDPIKIEAVRSPTGVTLRAFDAAELFEQATTASGQKRFADAEGHYKRLLAEFPGSSYARPVAFNLGMVYFDSLRFPEAARQFGEFIKGAAGPGPHPDTKDAWYLRGISLGKAADWLESEAAFVAILERDDLSPDDRVEAMARRGYARIGQGDLIGAEQLLRNVFDYKRKLDANAEARLDTDYYLAFAQFHMAQITHRQSTAVALRWPESQMNRDLEDKARLLLLARRRYIDAVKYGNPEVASMAAFEIGTLFQQFYDAIMAVPPPEELGGDAQREARDVYRDELRKKLRVVLEKSLRGHEHNIELFERLGVETEWVTKSRAVIDQLRRMLEPGGMNVAQPGAAPAPSSSPSSTPSTAPEKSVEPTAPRPPTLDDSAGDRHRDDPAPAIRRQIL